MKGRSWPGQPGGPRSISLGRLPKGALVSDSPWTGQDPEQAAVAADWDAVIHRLIDALPEELRQPLTLSSFEGLNSRESAKVLGISENAIRTRVMRARRILTEKLHALGAGHHEER
jgi:RNA polymerase sigma-70 factor (ECF subfamily)